MGAMAPAFRKQSNGEKATRQAGSDPFSFHVMFSLLFKIPLSLFKIHPQKSHSIPQKSLSGSLSGKIRLADKQHDDG